MNKNAESHFSVAPAHLGMRRSVFDRSHSLKTTFNAGKLIPFYLEQDVLPGDTFNMDFGATIRMSTNIHPTMDNCYLDTFFFFVPYRLVWTHWKEFCGENTDSYWTQTTEYTIPQLLTPLSGSFGQSSVADYLGLPTKVGNLSVSALPARAYALIYNEWFRDENLNTPCLIEKGDSDVTYSEDSYVSSASKGGALCPVAKYHDYFTSCLPQPQKNSDVLIPMSAQGAPLVSDFSGYGSAPNPTGDWLQSYAMPFYSKAGNSNDLVQSYMRAYQDSITYGDGTTGNMIYTSLRAPNTFSSLKMNQSSSLDFNASSVTSGIVSPGLVGTLPGSTDNKVFLFPYYADLTSAGSTINQLRMAFQMQKFYEKQALFGSRYTEVVRSMFGVISPDARLQRPEYLGGARISINISQVVQTSSTDDTSPQANVAAYSLTNTRNNGYRYTSTEHGIILGVCCVRTDHNYQQGIPRGFLRKTKFDFYWPVFSQIGNQPVYNSQIYAQGSETIDANTGIAYDDEVFGYQEAWASYRYPVTSNVTGQFRSNATGTLDSWHYADYYENMPTLSSAWIAETDVNINRTLAVSSSVADQFIADFYFKDIAYRVMPAYSIPGLIDHY